MGWRAKSWFLGVSLFYLVLAVLFGGLGTNVGLTFWQTGDWRPDWGMEEPSFWMGGMAWGILILLIQLYRIKCSIGRNNELEKAPLCHSLWSLQVGGQIKILILLLLLPALCWVGHWLAGL